MSFPRCIARYRPTQEVVDLGRPDRIFCGSSRMASLVKYTLVFTGMACLAATVGTAIAFFVFAPPALRVDNAGLVVAGAVGLLALGGLLVWAGKRLLRPACFLIYEDGMAFTLGREWTLLGWEDVKSFRPSRDDTHLLLKDGSRVGIQVSAPYVGELHEMILDRLVETCASHGIAFGADDEPADDQMAESEPFLKEAPSPVGMAFVGTLLVIAAAWFYLEDAGGLIPIDQLDPIGGKAVAGGLVLVVGIALIVKGFLELATGLRVRREFRRRWEARYRPNN